MQFLPQIQLYVVGAHNKTKIESEKPWKTRFVRIAVLIIIIHVASFCGQQLLFNNKKKILVFLRRHNHCRDCLTLPFWSFIEFLAPTWLIMSTKRQVTNGDFPTPPSLTANHKCKQHTNADNRTLATLITVRLVWRVFDRQIIG